MGAGLLGGDDRVLELDRGEIAQHCECTACHQIVPFKMTNFMLCGFYLLLKESFQTEKPSRSRDGDEAILSCSYEPQNWGREWGAFLPPTQGSGRACRSGTLPAGRHY